MFSHPWYLLRPPDDELGEAARPLPAVLCQMSSSKSPSCSISVLSLLGLERARSSFYLHFLVQVCSVTVTVCQPFSQLDLPAPSVLRTVVNNPSSAAVIVPSIWFMLFANFSLWTKHFVLILSLEGLSSRLDSAGNVIPVNCGGQ